jgi:hypothetical protein
MADRIRRSRTVPGKAKRCLERVSEWARGSFGEWRVSRRWRRDEPISGILARSDVDLLRQRDAAERRDPF